MQLSAHGRAVLRRLPEDLDFDIIGVPPSGDRQRETADSRSSCTSLTYVFDIHPSSPSSSVSWPETLDFDSRSREPRGQATRNQLPAFMYFHGPPMEGHPLPVSPPHRQWGPAHCVDQLPAFMYFHAPCQYAPYQVPWAGPEHPIAPPAPPPRAPAPTKRRWSRKR